jgi:hypothetical protein
MNIPPVTMVIAFLNAHELSLEEVQDSEYLDNVLSNMEEMMDFKGGAEWRSSMIAEYQKYFFKKKLESIK